MPGLACRRQGNPETGSVPTGEGRGILSSGFAAKPSSGAFDQRLRDPQDAGGAWILLSAAVMRSAAPCAEIPSSSWVRIT